MTLLIDLDKINWKRPEKEITILDASKNIRDSWEEVKLPTLTGVWKMIPTLMDDSEELKTSMEKVDSWDENEMKMIPDENAVKIAEMKTKDLDYHINLVNKAVAQFEDRLQPWKKFHCG